MARPAISNGVNAVNGNFIAGIDQQIEPNLMIDPARWLINNERDILRNKVVSAGSNMAMLPLNSQAFEKYTLKESLSISFQDKNGTADYAVFRGGSSRKGQTDCNCDNIYFEWLDETEN